MICFGHCFISFACHAEQCWGAKCYTPPTHENTLIGVGARVYKNTSTFGSQPSMDVFHLSRRNIVLVMWTFCPVYVELHTSGRDGPGVPGTRPQTAPGTLPRHSNHYFPLRFTCSLFCLYFFSLQILPWLSAHSSFCSLFSSFFPLVSAFVSCQTPYKNDLENVGGSFCTYS